MLLASKLPNTSRSGHADLLPFPTQPISRPCNLPPIITKNLSVLTTFPIFYAICMGNHRIIIGNVVKPAPISHTARRVWATFSIFYSVYIYIRKNTHVK